MIIKMSNIKYKVTGSFLDRTYYSNIFEIDSSKFESNEEIEDYLNDLIRECESDIYCEWDEEGSEDSGGGFQIESIERI
jgi:hypothetical protein